MKFVGTAVPVRLVSAMFLPRCDLLQVGVNDVSTSLTVS